MLIFNNSQAHSSNSLTHAPPPPTSTTDYDGDKKKKNTYHRLIFKHSKDCSGCFIPNASRLKYVFLFYSSIVFIVVCLSSCPRWTLQDPPHKDWCGTLWPEEAGIEDKWTNGWTEVEWMKYQSVFSIFKSLSHCLKVEGLLSFSPWDQNCCWRSF